MRLIFSDLDQQRWIEKHSTLGWSQHRIVCLGFWELGLSPRVAIDRSQKLINPFVSKTKDSASICICICITVGIDIIMALQHLELRIGGIKHHQIIYLQGWQTGDGILFHSIMATIMIYSLWVRRTSSLLTDIQVYTAVILHESSNLIIPASFMDYLRL